MKWLPGAAIMLVVGICEEEREPRETGLTGDDMLGRISYPA